MLVPDIKGEAHIVYEPGKLYPHHNLYFVTSRDWELRALQAVLLSDITRLFIELYSTKMRGGYCVFKRSTCAACEFRVGKAYRRNCVPNLVAPERRETNASTRGPRLYTD